MFELSERFPRKSQQFDQRSPNTLMSLAVTYHLSRKPDHTIDILIRHLDLYPSSQQALRMSVQSAGMVGD